MNQQSIALANSLPRLAPPSPFEEEPQCFCEECDYPCKADESAEVGGHYFCSTCFPPDQPAFDQIITYIDWAGGEIRRLRGELRRGRFAGDEVW